MQPRNRLCEPVLAQANPIVDHPSPIWPSTQANNQHAAEQEAELLDTPEDSEDESPVNSNGEQFDIDFLDEVHGSRLVRQKLFRKSMTYMDAENLRKEVADIKASLPSKMIDHLKSDCRLNSGRRRLLSLVALDHKRKAVCHALQTYIIRSEWRLCKIHAKHPGVLKPVKKEQHQRMEINPKSLDKFAKCLHKSGHLQRTAFGRQLKEIMHGSDTIEVDNVAI
jgi:hypothetical protein